jgi:hypothetical protein
MCLAAGVDTADVGKLQLFFGSVSLHEGSTVSAWVGSRSARYMQNYPYAHDPGEAILDFVIL